MVRGGWSSGTSGAAPGGASTETVCGCTTYRQWTVSSSCSATSSPTFGWFTPRRDLPVAVVPGRPGCRPDPGPLILQAGAAVGPDLSRHCCRGCPQGGHVGLQHRETSTPAWPLVTVAQDLIGHVTELAR